MSIKNEWQRKWREILGKPTGSMPDIDEDFALHFDIWNVGDEKLEKCFTVFPNGDQLLKRVNEVKSTRPQLAKMTDEDLLKLLDQLNQDIEIVLHDFGDTQVIEFNGAKSATKQRSVYRGNETIRRELLRKSDSPTIHLDDVLSEIIKKHCGAEGYEAFLFLSEPLYQLSGCYYTVSHWIAWAMVEAEYNVDPYQAAFDLYKIKAQAGWSSEEQFVYIAS